MSRLGGLTVLDDFLGGDVESLGVDFFLRLICSDDVVGLELILVSLCSLDGGDGGDDVDGIISLRIDFSLVCCEQSLQYQVSHLHLVSSIFSDD